MITFKKTAKLILFALLFLAIYSYSAQVLRNKSESEALGIIMKAPDETYDVILSGPSHMQYALQPAALFGEYGIASCNTSTAAQSLPTTYYVLKEMIKRHTPELVVVDLFCLFYPEVYFSPTRFHQAIDNFPLSLSKAQAINDLVDVSKSEFYLNYLLYHSRWKELTEKDYTILSTFNEKYQLLYGTYPYPQPFHPLDPEDTAQIPEVPLEYLEKIVKLCKDTNTRLLLTVIPYRADVDNNNTSATLQMQMYNTVSHLASEWEVDFLNGLYVLDEIGFDFTTDMVEYSHVNTNGAQKLSHYYGKYIKENYNIPDRTSDKNYSDWNNDYKEYLNAINTN